MDDTLKNLTFGLLALLVLHGGLEQRAKRDINRQVRETFAYTGQVRTTIEPRGMLGLLASDIYAVDVYGERLRTDRLPFYLYPRAGWKGRIQHLRLHPSDVTLSGL